MTIHVDRGRAELPAAQFRAFLAMLAQVGRDLEYRAARLDEDGRSLLREAAAIRQARDVLDAMHRTLTRDSELREPDPLRHSASQDRVP